MAKRRIDDDVARAERVRPHMDRAVQQYDERQASARSKLADAKAGSGEGTPVRKPTPQEGRDPASSPASPAGRGIPGTRQEQGG